MGLTTNSAGDVSGFALSSGTFTALGGAVKDIFAVGADKQQAQGDAVEAGDYRQAAAFARQNEIFDKQTEVLQSYQADRATFMGLSSQQADIGGAGLANSGSAIYLAMDSAKQGALAKEQVIQQGQIAIAGHEEQATSYDQMAAAADAAAAAAKKKETSDWIGAGLELAAAII